MLKPIMIKLSAFLCVWFGSDTIAVLLHPRYKRGRWFFIYSPILAIALITPFLGSSQLSKLSLISSKLT